MSSRFLKLQPKVCKVSAVIGCPEIPALTLSFSWDQEGLLNAKIDAFVGVLLIHEVEITMHTMKILWNFGKECR